MKTTQSDGVVFASWLPASALDAGGPGPGLGQRAFVGLELSGGHLRYVFIPAGVGSIITSVQGGTPSSPSASSPVISIRGPAGHQPINDHRWHDIAVVVTALKPTSEDWTSPGDRHALHVDNASKAETLHLTSQHPSRYGMTASSTWSTLSPVELYVGGLPPALMQALPKQVNSDVVSIGFEYNAKIILPILASYVASSLLKTSYCLLCSMSCTDRQRLQGVYIHISL